MYLNNAPDIKFAQKSFKETLYNSPELQKAFAIASKECMDKLLSDTRTKEAEVEMIDINSAILSLG